MGVWGVEIGAAAGGGGGGLTPPTTGLWSRWKGDDLSGADGAAISAWSDASGNGRSLAQATSAKQPVKKTAIVNGHAVARFAGTDDVLSLTGITPPGLANPSDLSIFVLMKAAATGTGGLVCTRNGNGGWLLRQTNDTTVIFAHPAVSPNASVTTASLTGNWTLIEMVRTALSAKIGSQGTMPGSGTGMVGYPAVPASPLRLDVGCEASTQDNPTTNPYTGDIAEILIYDTALSDTDRDQLEAYIAAEYALTIA